MFEHFTIGGKLLCNDWRAMFECANDPSKWPGEGRERYMDTEGRRLCLTGPGLGLAQYSEAASQRRCAPASDYGLQVGICGIPSVHHPVARARPCAAAAHMYVITGIHSFSTMCL